MMKHVRRVRHTYSGLFFASIVFLSACSVFSSADETLPTGSALSADNPTSVLGPTSVGTPFPANPAQLTTATPPATVTAPPTSSPTPIVGPTSTLSPLALTSTAQAPLTGLLEIEYFNATPTAVNPGGTVTLVWSTSGAIQATLFRLNPDDSFAEALQVDTVGTRTLAASASDSTETFILRISDGSNTLDSKVTIAISCGRTWFFTASASQTCPSAAAADSPAAEETFERGWMYWVELTDTIYVLYNDGGSPAWQSFEDTWLAGEPEFDSSIVPPGGNLHQPGRGIGKVWRNNATVRDRLGWATEPEQAFSTTFQREASSDPNIYYVNRNGQLVHLNSGGSDWNLSSLPSP